MTVAEMKSKIIEHCDSRSWCMDNDEDGCACPLWKNAKYGFCYEYGDDAEGLKSNYEAIFGKPQFTLSDIKAGYLVRARKGDLCLVVERLNGKWGLYNKCDTPQSNEAEYREDMTDIDDFTEYDIIEVYGLDTYKMFEPSTRELLYKRENVINTKEYYISNIKVSPNSKTYDNKNVKHQVFIENANGDEYFAISIDEAKELAKSLQEIVDYVEGVK